MVAWVTFNQLWVVAGTGDAGTWVTFVIMTESAVEQTTMPVMISILTPCPLEKLE